MEVPDRDQQDEALAALLLPIFADWLDELLRMQIIRWDVYRVRIRNAVRERAAAIFLFLILIYNEERGVGMPLDEAALRAIDYATNRAQAVADAIVENVSRAYYELTSLVVGANSASGPVESIQYPGSDGKPDPTFLERIRNAIRRILTPERARRLATTEVTAAQTAGQDRAIQEYQRTTSIVLDGVWVTRKSEFGLVSEGTKGGVCKICEPLHMKPRAVWGDKFPLGPPAHPNCRCYLNYS